MLPYFFFPSYLLILRLSAPSFERPDLSIPLKPPPSPRKAPLTLDSCPLSFSFIALNISVNCVCVCL